MYKHCYVFLNVCLRIGGGGGGGCLVGWLAFTVVRLGMETKFIFPVRNAYCYQFSLMKCTGDDENVTYRLFYQNKHSNPPW